MDSKLNYKRIVIKIGSSSLTHAETGRLNLAKMEHLVRQLSDLHNQGMDVCLVSSGAIAVGRAAMGVKERPSETSVKQACAAVGQAKLMMVYQKLFAEYSQTAGQILLTKNTMVNPVSRANAKNTFDELFHLGVHLFGLGGDESHCKLVVRSVCRMGVEEHVRVQKAVNPGKRTCVA